MSAQEGWQLALTGMGLADGAESGDWKNRADATMEDLAASGRDFTSEDLISVVGMPSHPNAMGMRFVIAKRKGLIERVGWKNSSINRQHAHALGLWRGVKKKP